MWEVWILNGETLYWWIDHIASITAVPLALLGFGVTLWQLRKTRTAASAAYNATLDMKRQIRRTNLATLLPQLTRIEDEIYRAVENKSTESLHFWIGTWRWQASEARAYLVASEPQEKKVLRSIQASISTAADTRSQIHDLKDFAKLAELTVDLRKDVSRVTGELGGISAQQVLESGGMENG